MVLKRKIESTITQYLSQRPRPSKMMVVEGARQIGKSYIIRKLGEEYFPNFIELNMEEDRQHDRLFAEAKTVDDFYLAMSTVAGDKMGNPDDTLVFIDEIQAYDHLLTLAKFLMADGRFSYIASGSMLGVALRKTQSVPVGSLEQVHMYPMDFEEFLWANGVGDTVIDEMRKRFERDEELQEALHNKIMDLFLRYLLVGGMPDAVKTFIAEHNIVSVRKVQTDIMALYKADTLKYEQDSFRRLKALRIYEMIPANMANVKKRVVLRQIEEQANKRTADYAEEFEYLVSAGIALEVKAISKPSYPLVQNSGKNLLKLYLNDVGLLTSLLYGTNIMPVLNDVRSINLGAVYETVVAQELKAHGFNLYYYDNKKNGEVDYLIDSQQLVSVVPIEVKSGRDYKIHTAIDRFVNTPDYNIVKGYVFSNERRISMTESGKIVHTPIYNIMFLQKSQPEIISF